LATLCSLLINAKRDCQHFAPGAFKKKQTVWRDGTAMLLTFPWTRFPLLPRDALSYQLGLGKSQEATLVGIWFFGSLALALAILASSPEQ
jgi:hypothetical protein